MNLSSAYCTILAGPTIPIPLPASLAESVREIEIRQSDNHGSGFQIEFTVGNSGSLLSLDYFLLQTPQIQPFNRIIISVTLNGIPEVLMDGIITHLQFHPDNNPGNSRVTITGEDLSILMNREEKIIEYPSQDETVIANQLILGYAEYGIIPMVIPPPIIDMPLPTERIPMQYGTDLAHLNEMAERYDYVFYVTPGMVPFTNIAYWGPPQRLGIPQSALSVNMGSATNVVAIDFSYDALSATTFQGEILDPQSNQTLPIFTFGSERLPLSATGAIPLNPYKKQFLDSGHLNYQQACARAQAQTEASIEKTVTATGTLDVARYGGLLKARGLVGVRGCGESYDGWYYVQKVEHHISLGNYTQRFTLTREGTGTLTPVVSSY